MLNKIRPTRHKLIQNSLLLKDINELLERDFEEISICPACESSKRKLKFKKYGLKFFQCDECNSIYMNPRPSKKSMDIYYRTSRNYKYWAENIFPESSKSREELICKPSINRIKKTISKFEKLENLNALEIGPGFGIFASHCIKEKVFSSYEVIEPTPPLAEHCQNLGILVHKTTIEDFKSTKKYQIICAFEVIEHLYNPSEIIRYCYEILDNYGFLVVSCPNGVGLDTKMLGPFSPSVDNEHVNLFSPKGVEDLFTKNGFNIISIQTPGKMDVEIIEEFINESPGILQCENEFKKLIMECNGSKEKLQEKIAKQNESGHMWIFAQKRSRK